jgi:hypothetical protein
VGRSHAGFGPLFIGVSIATFVVGMAIAMAAYPGGTWCERSAMGHDFLRNFFCDLLHDVALNGQPSPVAAAASRVAMLALLAGVLVTYALAPHLFAGRGHAGRGGHAGDVVRGFGSMCALGGVGVAFTPSNHHPTLHSAFVFVATVPGLVAMIAASLALLRAKATRAVGGLSTAAVLVGGVDAWLYARQLDGSHPCEIALPALERVAAALLLAWMASVAWRVAATRRASP